MIASTLLLTLFFAAGPHPYTVKDQVMLRRLSGFDVSPDGKNAVMVVRSTDYDANKGLLDLWRLRVESKELERLTSHPGPDGDPVFSPDGKSIFFVSVRGDTSQVWRLPLEGGEPVQVTSSPVDVNTFTLSRDGKLLCFAADVFADCDGDTLACTEKRLNEKSKSKASGRIYDRLFVRHWDTLNDGRRSHLFVQPVAGGPAKDIMKKMDADAPSRPFGSNTEFTFTPDGKSVVFAARDVGREEAWSTDFDLFLSPADGSAAPKKLTPNNKAWDTSPSFSPDGKTLAYLAMSRPGYESDKLTLKVREWPGGAERSLTDKWDHSVDAMAWSADSKTLFVTSQNLGQLQVFAIDVLGGGAPVAVTADGNVTGLQVRKDTLFVARDSLAGPSDLYSTRAEAKSGALERLTSLNEEAMKQVKLGSFEQFSFKGAKDETVYGYVVKPVDFDAKKKYPLAFLIHGGPQGSFGNHWHYRWNPQTYAGRGYVAVMIDFHGSTGYGQAFTDAINGDWGGAPLEDLKKGLDAALAKYPFIDKSRMCALGASYGGFMINYIAGVWNEPWKCLVNHDGNLDEKFAYFATEELWFPEWEHGGTPWEKPAGYEKHNPLDHVAKWKTPMLVVHGGKDYRVVDVEGMATFTVLQRRNIPSKFLYFPDENHWVLKPQNSVLWHDTVNAWLDQWTSPSKK